MKRTRFFVLLAAIGLMVCLSAGCLAGCQRQESILTEDGHPLPEDFMVQQAQYDIYPFKSFEEMAKFVQNDHFVAIVEIIGEPKTVAIFVPPEDEIEAAKREGKDVYRFVTYSPARITQVIAGDVAVGDEFIWAQQGTKDDRDDAFVDYLCEPKVKQNKSYILFAEDDWDHPEGGYYRSFLFSEGWYEIAGNHVKTYDTSDFCKSNDGKKVEDMLAEIQAALAAVQS
nr:hypothetical protein [bacterium]